jgi:hypothetical protein
MREDLELQSFAESKGWEIRKHICDQRQLTPRFPIQFHKKNKVIWKTSLGWACADVVDTPCFYSNHRYRKSLREVLECESK